jgi:flagellar biosynthetic protein FlhB
MAEENDSQEKTEEPSQRKIDKSREEGRLLTSKEMFVFTGIALGWMLISATPLFGADLLRAWGSLFVIDHAEMLDSVWLAKLHQTFWSFIIFSVAIGLPIIIVVLLTQAAVGGINFAPKAMAFKGSRINPISGLARIFSIKGLVELGKSILKVVLLFGVGSVFLVLYAPRILPLAQSTLNQSLATMLQGFQTLIGAMAAVLFAIALIDFFWQQHTHMQTMRMSHKEMKDEMKETEGSPEVKAKIRRMQAEQSMRSAQQREALGNIGEATAVIVNPTHFAVALRYVAAEGNAPTVIAMGKGPMAERIIEAATSRNITIFRSPLLARALYFTGNIGAEISEKLYNAVAVVLAYIYRLDRGEILPEPEVTVPADMMFDENGRPVT